MLPQNYPRWPQTDPKCSLNDSQCCPINSSISPPIFSKFAKFSPGPTRSVPDFTDIWRYFPHFESVQFLIHNWNVLLARMEFWRAKSPFFAEYSTVDICKSPHAQCNTTLTIFQGNTCFTISNFLEFLSTDLIWLSDFRPFSHQKYEISSKVNFGADAPFMQCGS